MAVIFDPHAGNVRCQFVYKFVVLLYPFKRYNIYTAVTC